MNIDHIVIWVTDVEDSLRFYLDVLGFEGVRVAEYRQGSARFPSVRINQQTILDIMETSQLLPLVQRFTGGDGVGGTPINHICLSMSQAEYDSIIKRLKQQGIALTPGGEDVFGAQGQAVRSTYFNDLDGNVLEIRFYPDAVTT